MRMRILIIKLDGIGDVVLATPFLRELRKFYPSAEITMVVDPSSRSLLEHCPYIDLLKAYSCQRRDTKVGHDARVKKGIFSKVRSKLKSGLSLLCWAGNEFKGRYDLAIVPRWGPNTPPVGLLTFLSGAKKRVTFSESASLRSCAKWWWNFFYTDVVHTARSVHERDINLELINYLGGAPESNALELWLPESAKKSVKKMEASCGIFSQTVCVAFGSLMKVKEWHADKYGQVITWILSNTACQVLLIGGPMEAGNGEALACQFDPGRVINLAGKTNLCETTVLLENSLLYIGNDSGCMHLATAVNTPVVMVSCFPKDGDPRDLNSPARFGPCPEVPSVVLQPEKALPPCDRQCNAGEAHCIEQVTVDEVIAAVDQMLSLTVKHAGNIESKSSEYLELRSE